MDIFMHLPNEVYMNILIYLPYEELIDKRMLCKSYFNILTDQHFWKCKYQFEYKDTVDNTECVQNKFGSTEGVQNKFGSTEGVQTNTGSTEGVQTNTGWLNKYKEKYNESPKAIGKTKYENIREYIYESIEETNVALIKYYYNRGLIQDDVINLYLLKSALSDKMCVVKYLLQCHKCLIMTGNNIKDSTCKNIFEIIKILAEKSNKYTEDILLHVVKLGRCIPPEIVTSLAVGGMVDTLVKIKSIHWDSKCMSQMFIGLGIRGDKDTLERILSLMQYTKVLRPNISRMMRTAIVSNRIEFIEYLDKTYGLNCEQILIEASNYNKHDVIKYAIKKGARNKREAINAILDSYNTNKYKKESIMTSLDLIIESGFNDYDFIVEQSITVTNKYYDMYKHIIHNNIKLYIGAFIGDTTIIHEALKTGADDYKRALFTLLDFGHIHYKRKHMWEVFHEDINILYTLCTNNKLMSSDDIGLYTYYVKEYKLY